MKSYKFNIDFLIRTIKAKFRKETLDVTEFRKNMLSELDKLNESMNNELDNLAPEEKLFANFLRGKLTAYAEIKDLLNKSNFN